MNLSWSQVSFEYTPGVPVLRQVDLAIQSGETVAIVGSNGAGKTTLVKLLNGLLRPTAGQVSVGNWNTADFPVSQLARRVAFAFQNPGDQLFERTVRSEVGFGPRQTRVPKDEQDRRVAEALALVGLSAAADSHPYDLNPADRKLITLAAAVVMRAPVSVLDEPTTGQDASGLERVDQVIQSLKQSRTTLILISHDMDFCADHADRVVVMDAGSILGDGPAPKLFDQTELLRRAGLEAPQLVRLAHGLGMAAAPLSIEAFLEDYSRMRGGRA